LNFDLEFGVTHRSFCVGVARVHGEGAVGLQ